MKMWMIKKEFMPFMCDKHLQLEYYDLFKLAEKWNTKYNISYAIKNKLIEPASIEARRVQLVNEMLARKYEECMFMNGDHNTSIVIARRSSKLYHTKVNRIANQQQLFGGPNNPGCRECRRNKDRYYHKLEQLGDL